MIPSRTKHESFDSFGSHAHLFQSFINYLWAFNSHIFHVMSLSSPAFFYSISIQYIFLSKKITNPRPKYLEDSSDQWKIYNCQQRCFFFFLQIQRILITLYVGYQFCIINKGLKSFYRHECFISKTFENLFLY